jgi:peptide subunit release factor 1 (eRF1)
MIAKDYLFKTIEFGKVDTVTKYMVTKLQPIFPGNVYVEHPDKKFIYTSYEEMVTDIKATLNYTDDQIATL